MQQQAALNDIIGKIAMMHESAAAAQKAVGGREGKPWYSLELFKNINPFTGEQKEWEEFSGKMRGQMPAHSGVTAEAMDYVETKLSENELELDTVQVEVAGQEVDPETSKEINSRLYNVLLNLTTLEANAVVRMCKERNGLRAWKGCTRLSTRERWHQGSS